MVIGLEATPTESGAVRLTSCRRRVHISPGSSRQHETPRIPGMSFGHEPTNYPRVSKESKSNNIYKIQPKQIS